MIDQPFRDDASQSHLDYCLRPLLKSLQWRGDEHYLFEAMPHMLSIDNTEKFSWVMKNLGYATKTHIIALEDISEKNLPCLFVPKEGGAPIVIMEKTPTGLSVFQSDSQKIETITHLAIPGTALYFKKTKDELIKEDYQNWFHDVIYNCKGMIFLVLVLSFFQAILFLMTPIYIMFLYSEVIVSHSYTILLTFTAGIMFGLYSLKKIIDIRTRILGHFGSRLQNNIGVVIFARLLKLQPAYIETAPVSRQILRISDFNQLREFFGGPLFSTLFELPFILIFLGFIWLIGGILILVPLAAIFFYFIIAAFLWFFEKKTVKENASVKAQYQNYLLETFSGMRSLQYAGLQAVWFKRFEELCAAAALYGKHALWLNSLNEVVFDALTLLTGLATLVVGTVLIMHEQIHLGALIAILFMIWRLLAPIKTLAVVFPKLIQVKKSINQINDLMRFPTEIPTEHQWENTPKQLFGDIRFEQVAFRYPGSDTLILKNVNFSVKKGETVLVLGTAASGKSTIIALLLSLYPILGGYVYLDGKNIKQFDVHFLRRHIAYAPQQAELFYGTLEQNLKLSNPLASKEAVIAAVKAANLWEDIEKLPDGLDTRIRFYGDYRFGVGFCQKMNLARAYLKDAPILILDEPTNGLDGKSAAILTDYLASNKGKKTILLFENNTKHIHLANIVVVLQEGVITLAGKPDDVLKKIPKGMVDGRGK